MDLSFNELEVIEDLKNLIQLESLDISNNKIIDWFQIVNFFKISFLLEYITKFSFLTLTGKFSLL